MSLVLALAALSPTGIPQAPADSPRLWQGTLGPNALALELRDGDAPSATLYLLDQDAAAIGATLVEPTADGFTATFAELSATVHATHDDAALSLVWEQPQLRQELRFDAANALELVERRRRATALGVAPRAPLATAQFAFLVGEWRGATTRLGPDGEYVEVGTITWVGEWLLDGRAVQNTSRTVGAHGGVVQHGVDTRVFHAPSGEWRHRYLDAFTGDFLELSWRADERGVLVSNVVAWREPDGRMADHVIRIELLDEDRFRWTADVSFDGGESWIRENQVNLNERVRAG